MNVICYLLESGLRSWVYKSIKQLHIYRENLAGTQLSESEAKGNSSSNLANSRSGELLYCQTMNMQVNRKENMCIH